MSAGCAQAPREPAATPAAAAAGPLPPAPDAARALPREAEDLQTLAWLHAAERPSAAWVALHRAGFPQGLVLLPPGHEALAAMSQALEGLAQRAEADAAQADDALAADYAAIYLTHACRASPCESVWRDEDHLMHQQATFAVRAWYQAHGLAAADWRTMPDDHIALQLAFCAQLIGRGEAEACARFIDEHIGSWVPGFAQRVAQRADTDVYAALAVLTAQALQSLRDGPVQALVAAPRRV